MNFTIYLFDKMGFIDVRNYSGKSLLWLSKLDSTLAGVDRKDKAHEAWL